jgi:hypothetical protein
VCHRGATLHARLLSTQVPEDLQQIRAFVRWEEAGKPNNTSPEWQQARSACSAPAALSAASTALSARLRVRAAPPLRVRARECRAHNAHTPGLTRRPAVPRARAPHRRLSTCARERT